MKEGFNKQQRRPVGGFLRAFGFFALGAATGGIFALLYAPASGRVTRRRIGLRLRAVQRTTIRQIGQARKVLARKAVYLREAATERLADAGQWVAGHVTNGHSNARRQARQRVAHHS